jgi:hypothetical protein
MHSVLTRAGWERSTLQQTGVHVKVTTSGQGSAMLYGDCYSFENFLFQLVVQSLSESPIAGPIVACTGSEKRTSRQPDVPTIVKSFWKNLRTLKILSTAWQSICLTTQDLKYPNPLVTKTPLYERGRLAKPTAGKQTLRSWVRKQKKPRMTINVDVVSSQYAYFPIWSVVSCDRRCTLRR